MPSTSTFLLFGLAALGLLVIPGPAVVYIVTRSIHQGRAAGLVSVLGVATGSLDFAISGEAWLWLVAIALVSTVVAVSAFFAGLRRVGPSEASIISTFEPPVTVALAFVVLGERLTIAQLAGGALVLAAVIVLQLPSRRRRGRDSNPRTRLTPVTRFPVAPVQPLRHLSGKRGEA